MFSGSLAPDPLSKSIMNSLEQFVPFRIFELLGNKDGTPAKLGDQKELKLTVMFSDIRNFSTISESLKPKENFDFVNAYLGQMDAIIEAQNGIINKFLGDGIMALFPSDADDALTCSIGMHKQLALFNQQRINEPPVRTGIGLNTGLCMLGIVGGLKRMEATVIGDIVNIASRIETLTKRFGVQILISENTLNSLSDIDRYFIRLAGRVQIKGFRSAVSVYEVFDTDEEAVRVLKNETKLIFEEALANYHFRKMEMATALFERCLEINPDDRPARYYLDRCKEFNRYHYHEGTGELFQKQVEWSRDFELGNSIIDKQHFGLFQQCIKLQESVRNGMQMNQIEETIRFLDEYVEEHFRTEETFLQFLEYPFIEHQKGQHRNFLKAFDLLKKDISSGMKSKIYIMFKIQTLLIDWVMNHTLKEDRHYGKYSKSHSPSLKGRKT